MSHTSSQHPPGPPADGSAPPPRSPVPLRHRRPAWVTTAAILAICFGCLRLFNYAYLTVMPVMLDFQKTMMAEMQSSVRQAQRAVPNRTPVNPAGFFSVFERWLVVPPWFRTWAPVLGIAGVLVTAALLAAAISLLQLKPWAPRFLCVALAASLLMSAALTAVAFASRSPAVLLYGVWGLVGLALDAVLIFIVAGGDKSAFEAAEADLN